MGLITVASRVISSDAIWISNSSPLFYSQMATLKESLVHPIFSNLGSSVQRKMYLLLQFWSFEKSIELGGWLQQRPEPFPISKHVYFFGAWLSACTLFSVLFLRIVPDPRFIVPHQNDWLRGALGSYMVDEGEWALELQWGSNPDSAVTSHVTLATSLRICEHQLPHLEMKWVSPTSESY